MPDATPAKHWARQGFRVVGSALYFEDIPIAHLDYVPGLYPSAKDRLVQLVNSIEGTPAPAELPLPQLYEEG